MKPTIGLIAFTLLAAGGCGDDRGARLSEAEFLRRTDALCTEGEAKRAAGKATPETVDELIRGLRDIQPPIRIEPEFDTWLASLENIRQTAIAVRDASSPADRRAAEARLAAAVKRIFQTQSRLPLPKSCKS